MIDANKAWAIYFRYLDALRLIDVINTWERAATEGRTERGE